MEWVAVTFVGFVGATTVVIALGRTSTARWELELEGEGHRHGRHRRPRVLRTRRVRRGGTRRGGIRQERTGGHRSSTVR